MITPKKVWTVYAESTPNPATMKFVASQFLLLEGHVEYTDAAQATSCPLARQLFSFSGVAGVFIMSNFVTITKHEGIDWFEFMPILRESIKGYLESGEPVFTGPAAQMANAEIGRTTVGNELEDRIIATLEEYVKPAVEQDGGAIQFKSFEDGKVTVILQGSCSGCPSSTMTLKSGIETLLRTMIPEVKEVVAQAD
jgi:Fe-S cluster biogenesis protein NfuA